MTTDNSRADALTDEQLDAALAEFELAMKTDPRNTDHARNSPTWPRVARAIRKDSLRAALLATSPDSQPAAAPIDGCPDHGREYWSWSASTPSPDGYKCRLCGWWPVAPAPSPADERADAPLSLIPHLIARDERAVSAALLEMCDAMVTWRSEAQKYREITSHDQSAFSDGYEAGIAAILTARAASANETVPKWVFNDLVNTLQPAWDYIQTHQEQFNARAGDDKNAILVEFFLRAASANETGAEGAKPPIRSLEAVRADEAEHQRFRYWQQWFVNHSGHPMEPVDAWQMRATLDAGRSPAMAAEACKTCGGSRVVDDGEITGSGGVEFENGPIKCVKDCPDCTVPQPAQADARVGLTMTREQRGVLTRLATVLETGHANNGIADDNAEIYAMAIRALLATPQPEPRAEVTDDDASLWRYVAQHAVVVDGSTEGMVVLTIAKDVDSGALELAARNAVELLAARTGASS